MSIKPTPIQGYFKRGSSWQISLTRKTANGAPVNLSELVTRAMFRVGGENGLVMLTLAAGTGIDIIDPATGTITLKVSRTQSELFTAGDKVYFDVEQTSATDADYAWQSQTYYFSVIEQVTRDD